MHTYKNGRLQTNKQQIMRTRWKYGYHEVKRGRINYRLYPLPSGNIFAKAGVEKVLSTLSITKHAARQ